jgi:ubiquinone/menaquinone biosynthesis C-methylase UbiE
MLAYDFLMQVEGYTRNLGDVASATPVRPGSRVLDAGSGTGNLSMLLKARGARVVSCDFSPTALAIHRSKDPDAEQSLASLEEPLSFADGEFDVVCCASVLFALSQQGVRMATREFLRVLSPGGTLVVTVGSSQANLSRLVQMYVEGLRRRNGPWSTVLKAMGGLPALVKVLYYNHRLRRLRDWEGFHLFTEAELRALVQDAGFTGIQIERTYGGSFLLLTAHRPGTQNVAEATLPASHMRDMVLPLA